MTKVIDLREQRRRMYQKKLPPVWSYGVTTCASRKGTLLPRTLQSLKDGGFPEPIIFEDRGFGAYANWALGMAELWYRNPSANRYALFEDDVICYANLRQYLDRVYMPDDECWNLYTSPRLHPIEINRTNTKHPTGFFPAQNGWCLGALGLVYSNQAMRSLLSDPEFFDHAIFKQNNQDGVAGRILTRQKIKVMVHHPSLLQHTGEESATGKCRHSYHETLALSFINHKFDALSLLTGVK